MILTAGSILFNQRINLKYVKVKVVEYEMLSVMALEGVKLLRKEFEDFKKQLNNK